MSTGKNIKNERLEVKNFIDYFKKSKIQLEMVMVKHSSMMSEECMNAINEEIMHYRNAISFFEQYLNDNVEIPSRKSSSSVSSSYSSSTSQPRAPFRSDVRDMKEVDVAEDMDSEDGAEENEPYKGEERRRNNPNAVRATPIGHERRRRKIRKNSSGLTSLTESKRRFDEMVETENENENEDEQRRMRRNSFQSSSSASRMRPEMEDENESDDEVETYEQEDERDVEYTGNEEEGINGDPSIHDVNKPDTETDEDIPPVQAEAEEPIEEESAPETEIETARAEKEEETGSDENEENKKNNWIKSRLGGKLEAPEMISPLDGKPILADEQDTVPSANANDAVSGEASQEQKVESANTTDAPASTNAIREEVSSGIGQQQENTEPTAQAVPEEKAVTNETTPSVQVEQEPEAENALSTATTQTSEPATTPVPEPNPVMEKKEPFEPVEFNISEEWKFRNKDQRIRINQDVQTVAKMGNLSATDVKVICALAENKQYEFDLIIRNAGEIAEDPNKWIASINKLVRLNLANFLHGDKENQYIFLTENGLWLYGLTQKKNPFTFRRTA